MSTAENNQYNSTVETRSRHTFHNEVVQRENKNSIQSDEGFNENNSEQSSAEDVVVTRRPKLSAERDLFDSSRISVYRYSLDEELIMNNIVEQLKNEEQRMKKELQSMKSGEERLKHEIILLKYRQNRMEYEIELMKCRETTPVRPSIHNNEIEEIKKQGKHLTYEIERMKHYETRLINEIRSIENEINRIQYLLPSDYYEEISQSEIQFNKHTQKLEQLSKEREKRQIKLREHSNDIKKRNSILEEYLNKQIEFETKLKKEKERIHSEQNSIKQRQNFERQLLKLNAKLIKCEIDLLEHSAECIRAQIQFAEDNKNTKEFAIEHHRLCEELSEKRIELHTIYEQLKLTKLSLISNSEDSDLEEFEPPRLTRSFSIIHNDYDISLVIQQPKYEIFISSTGENNSTISCIKNALPQHLAIHMKRNESWSDIKICLDNTSMAVIAIINTAYEDDAFCPAEITEVFKRQCPLILVISEQDFEPSTVWLHTIWQASTTQKITLDCPNFEENLRNALTNAQWNLSSNLNIATTIDKRSKRFLGDTHEWTVVYSNPAQVSQNYRQLINDPLRITTDTKLRDIYYNYIRMYFENSDVMELVKRAADENDLHYLIQAYTQNEIFSATINNHLVANILFYFEPILHENINYQLVKCLIDFVALFIYRQELTRYLFSGIVYRAMLMTKEDLSKYIVGARIINTSFLSTSVTKAIVNIFPEDKPQEFRVICRYVIHNKNNRRTAIKMNDMSDVLILPLSAFHVESIQRSANNSEPIELVLVEDGIDIYSSSLTIKA